MSGFLVYLMGEIEKADFPDIDNIYCKFSFVYGPDWAITSGCEQGMTQIAKTSPGFQHFVWNFPLDIAFKSTNPHGWPRIILSVYGLDMFGNDVVRGYGVYHIPTSAGSWKLRLPMFIPQSSSTLQSVTSWLTGRRPEYVDPQFIGSGDGREITRTENHGMVWVNFNLITKNLSSYGLDNTQHPTISKEPFCRTLGNSNVS